MRRTKTKTCHSRSFGNPLMASTKERSSWRSRPAILRTALALGLGLLGLTGVSRDAHATFTVKPRPGYPWNDLLWDRRPMTNGSGGCRIPYTTEIETTDMWWTVQNVLDYLERNTNCVWDIKGPSDVDYVAIKEDPYNSPADWVDISSNSGRTGNWRQGRQEMSIYHGCTNFGHILHELGHVMGLKHEHQRPDRDNTIDVFMDYVGLGWERAFTKLYDGETWGLPYDSTSIMHYTGWSFMEPAYAPWCCVLGLPHNDIERRRGRCWSAYAVLDRF